MGLSRNKCTQKGTKLADRNFRGAIASVAPVVPLSLSTIFLMVTVTESLILQDLKNIKNVKRCRDGMPKSMQTR